MNMDNVEKETLFMVMEAFKAQPMQTRLFMARPGVQSRARQPSPCLET